MVEDPTENPCPKPGRVLARKGLLMLLALAALVVAAYLIGSGLEARNRAEETRGDLTDRFAQQTTIPYQGETYRHRAGLTKILIMGVDRDTDEAPAGFRNGGQADFLLLMVFDAKAQTLALIQIDRDTMTPITVLGVLGNPAGTRTAQLSLAHGFGDGREQSCAFTADAVTSLLLGEPIDYFVSLQMDGISVLNDWAGGVTVTLTDDFSALDPAMLPGATLTLRGEQAETYVRSRMSIGIGTNEARMVRQQCYLKGLGELLDAKIQADANCIGELFDLLSPYLVTDMKRGRMMNIAWATKDYERLSTENLPGEHRIGSDGFMEYHIDPQQLTAAIIRRFYEPAAFAAADTPKP